MAGTYKDLTSAGAGDELAGLLARELRQDEPRSDLARHPMEVVAFAAFFVAFLVAMGARALAVVSLQADTARLKVKVDAQAVDIAEIRAELSNLRDGQASLKEDISEIRSLLVDRE